MACFLNSIQYPNRTFQPDFDDGLFSREYIEFQRGMNQICANTHSSISYNDYAKGTIFGFNFSPDLSDGCNQDGYLSPTHSGSSSFQETITGNC